jgi:hypothetical protein
MLTENLTVSSIPNFLTSDECDAVLASIRREVATLPAEEIDTAYRSRSVHSIEDWAVSDVIAVYEPEGRLEYEKLPADVEALLGVAVARALPAIRRTYPSVEGPDAWIYVSYGDGQFINPHIDYPNNDEDPGRPKVCGVSVLLNDEFEGGEFAVETACDLTMWEHGDPPAVRAGADGSTEWFRSMPRTRWVAKPARGTALLYGSALTHATLPVTAGRVEKVIGFLLATAR